MVDVDEPRPPREADERTEGEHPGGRDDERESVRLVKMLERHR
jgi:hypothetical protein